MEINDRLKADWMKQLNWLEGSISYPAAYFESSDSSKFEFRDKLIFDIPYYYCCDFICGLGIFKVGKLPCRT